MNYKERQEIISNSRISFDYLKKFNRNMGFLHLIQGILMLTVGLILDFSRDIYTFYLNFEEVSPGVFEINPNPTVLFTFSYVGAILASFLLLSALAHLLIAYPLNERYNANLQKGFNPYRWYEYALSSSIMIMFIALLFGVWDFWSLIMIFVLNATMILFGYVMELVNQYTEKTNWKPFLMGCISGAIPWIVIIGYFYGVTSNTDGPPDFVYAIFYSYLVLFNIFAINMVLQYKGVGPWRDYLFGERVYIILSLVAKSLLAWLAFGGILQPQ
ncbi:MAG: heliorhodopsin HeR [Promethearchaeota archaeon]